MKRGKKFLCLLLALSCLASLALTGCKTADNGNAPASTPTTAPTIAPTTQPTIVPTEAPTTVLTTAPTTEPTTVPTQAPTTAPTQQPTTQPTVSSTAWNDDKTLKILTIGNSFSVDCMQFVYQVAKANGVENVKLGNLYIAGCPLKTHLSNAQSDKAAYTYYTNDSGTWSTVSSYKMSAAVKSEDWDFVCFQQASPVSGQASTYDTLVSLMNLVEPLCTNENVRFSWHMTWAYQADSTNSSFENYGKNQTVMYNAITSAVQLKIVPNAKISAIIPNGTVIQNARTSYVGDTLTRDGYHLSKGQGRFLAALGVVDTLIGIDWETIDWSKAGTIPSDLKPILSDVVFLRVAEESVRNAAKTPFAVTESAIKTMTDIFDPAKYEKAELVLYKNQYWQSTKTTELTGQKGTMEKYFATEKFTRDTLPVGSIIYLADGWQYRPEAWVGDALNSTADRPANVTSSIIEVTEEWWGEWTARGFNICRKDGAVLSDYTNEQICAVFVIYIPKV